MNNYLLRRFVVPVLLLLTACGESTEPTPPYPAVAGSYQVYGTFESGDSWGDLHFDATLNIEQASRQVGSLTGTMGVIVKNAAGQIVVSELTQPFCGCSLPLPFRDPEIVQAEVTPDGTLSFKLINGATSWAFSGKINGNQIAGQHTLTDGITTHRGSWYVN